MIPRVAHFVFGLSEQVEPFHFLHYVSLESCRRVLEPETIYLHHKHLPWGPWWERICPHLTLVEADHVDEVLAAEYLSDRVPAEYLYAHHADFVRLDALIERGGVYADIDTIFLRPFPDELFQPPFVIGREPDVRDEKTGELRPSLCNALLLAEPGAEFARAWREQMVDALDGTWSNHSGFLSERLSRLSPAQVRVEPEVRFFPFPPDPVGLSQLLEQRVRVPADALSVHLWAHLWWDRGRTDFSQAHGGWCTPPFIRRARTTLAEIARPYLTDCSTGVGRRRAARDLTSRSTQSPSDWSYLSLDENSGYGVAAERCMAALEETGLAVEWTPFIPGTGWGMGYQPLPMFGELDRAATSAPVVVAHLLPEYFPPLRERHPDVFLVGHTVWETDRLPDHWIPCLEVADLLIVPSWFSARAIAASPVTTPVGVVPYVITPMASRASPVKPEPASQEVVFYTIAEWNQRKAVFKTVEAYLKAFSARDRVLLVVKTSYRDHTVARPTAGRAASIGTTAFSVARLIAGHPDPPPVKLVTRALTTGEISALHRQGDCFVSLCRSEGWGLGAFDAAAFGKPVVTTGFGGHLDYLGASPYLVDFDLVPVIDPAGFPSYAPEQRWAAPDVEHAASLLRQIAANPDDAKATAASMAADIRWRFRPAAIASALQSAIARHYSGRGRAQHHAANGHR
jgi:glycosyltransferase involved in cell wall biosynthesis